MMLRSRSETKQGKTAVFKKLFKRNDSRDQPQVVSKRKTSRSSSRRRDRDKSEDGSRTSAAVRQLWNSYKVDLLADDDDNILATAARIEREEQEYKEKYDSISISETKPQPTQHVELPLQQKEPKEVPEKATSKISPKASPTIKPQVTVEVTPISVSQELWNAAFDSIQETPEGKELTQKYLKILNKTLGDSDGEEVPKSFAEDAGSGPNQATARQRDMIQLVRTGLVKVKKSAKVTNTMGAFAEAVLAVRPFVDFVIQTVPQASPAALPWAGVCAGLQLLCRPANANKANLEGVKYVISRMEWYCALTDHLLDPWSIEAAGQGGSDLGAATAILDSLRQRVVGLYRKLLLFLMQSVCTYYKHQGIVFMKNITELHSKWASSLSQIKQDEANLRTDSDQFSKLEDRKILLETSDRATKTMQLVGRIDQSIRDVFEEQKQMKADEDDRALMKQLFVVDPKDDMDAIEMRKDALLDGAFKWILDVPEFKAFTNDFDLDESLKVQQSSCRLLWIKGPAGTGKTMLLLGIIRELSERPAALYPGIAHFFFQNADNTLNSSMAALRSLIWMLLQQQPHLLQHLREKYDKAPPTFSGHHAFVGLCKVFENMIRDPDLEPVYFIVDALDECDEGLPEFIKLIANSLDITDKVSWLVSSRPTVPLEEHIAANSLVELDSQRLEAPVNAYINHQLGRLRSSPGYTDAIISEMAQEITSRANNTYLWVWFVFQQLTKPNKFGKCLNGMYALKKVRQIPPSLSALYDHIMENIEQGDEEDPEYCKSAMRAVYHAYRPLSVEELATFVDLPQDQVVRIIGECGSFLSLTNATVSLIHQSANDYLTDNYNARLGLASIALGHAEMVRLCLSAMSERLHKNMYNLPDMGPYDRSTPSPDPDPLAAIRYACVYWIDHVHNAAGQSSNTSHEYIPDTELIHSFLLDHFLHWLEAISLLEKIPDGLASVRALRDILLVSDTSNFAGFVRDMLSFIMWNSYCIELSPLQSYASALLFSPKNSKVRRNFEAKHELDWVKIKPAVQDDWEPYVQLNGHRSMILSAGFSPDGKRIVSGSVDHTAKIWDVSSGMCICTLSGHTRNVGFVTFSVPDGKLVLSAEDKHTVMVWDVASEKCINTLEIPLTRKYVQTSCHALSTASSVQVATGFTDGIIEIRDVMSGQTQTVIEAYNKKVISLSFSLDGLHLTSTFLDGTNMRFEVVSGLCIETCSQLPIIENTALYSSPNENHPVARWDDDIIRVWDASSAHRAEVVGRATNDIFTMAFSPNGAQVAAGSVDGTVAIWDTLTGECLQELKEHAGMITTVAFFPDGQRLASSSYDGTVKLWSVTSGICLHTLDNHGKVVSDVAILLEGKYLVSLSVDGVVKIRDAVSLECRNELFNLPLDLVVSPDETRLMCITEDNKVEVYDVVTGERTHRIDDHKVLSMSRAFSPDGSKLAFQSDDEAIQVWNLLSHKHIQTLEGNDSIISDIAFSPNGSSLACITIRSVLKAWDIESGKCIREIDFFDGAAISTVFPPKGRNGANEPGQFYGLSWNGTWVIKDGKSLFWLPYQYRSGVMYAVHGERIAIGVNPGKAWVLEV